METHHLIAHPLAPPLGVSGVSATIVRAAEGWIGLRWIVAGAQRLVVPALAGRGRADELWRTTCFELFVMAGEGPGYSEFNLSPSERWAAYDFSGYREGMTSRVVPRAPVCTWRGGGAAAIFDAAVPLSALPAPPWHYGLSAVIEEEGGHRSYWALSQPPGQPDFHDRACFAGTLAAPAKS